jgi:hypothetical protein
MVPSSVLAVTVDDERLTCGGFSLNETVRLGCFEFIINYFSDLSLSHSRSNLGAAFMVSTHSWSPSLWWAMIEDSIKEFDIASSRERGFGFPSPRRHGVGALPAPVRTTPWMKNALAAQAMMMVLPQTVALRHWPPLQAMVCSLGGQRAPAHAR